MSAPDFDESLFWPEFKSAGMLKEASTVLPGCTQPTFFDVKFDRPDFDPMTGARSSDYEIEYQYEDVPTLTEGAQIIVDGVLYRVREDPYITAQIGASGFFRLAKLTRVATDCAP